MFWSAQFLKSWGVCVVVVQRLQIWFSRERGIWGGCGEGETRVCFLDWVGGGSGRIAPAGLLGGKGEGQP